MIESARRGERQLVGLLQARPSVGAPDELLREPEAKLRMRLQIRQTGDALAFCIVAAHRQRVRVVEPERDADREPHRTQLLIQLRKRGHRVELQYFLGDRARVLGIHVDVARRERVQDDRRIAQTLLMRRARFARRLRGLPDDLSENVRLGEALRADVQRRCRRCNGERMREKRDGNRHCESFS